MDSSVSAANVTEYWINTTFSTEYTCVNSSNSAPDVWAEEENQIFAELMLPVTIFMLMLMLIGGVGNAIVCIVYIIKRGKPAFQIYVLSLGVVDFFTCCLIHPYLIHKVYRYYNPDVITCKIFEYLIRGSIEVQIVLLVCIASDRYYAIKKPFRYANSKRVFVSIGVSLAVGCICALYVLPSYGWKQAASSCSGDGLHICDYRDGVGGTLAVTVFMSLEFAATFSCTIIIFVLYSVIARETLRGRGVPSVQVSRGQEGGDPSESGGGPSHIQSIPPSELQSSSRALSSNKVHPLEESGESSNTSTQVTVLSGAETSLEGGSVRPLPSNLLQVPRAWEAAVSPAPPRVTRRVSISRSISRTSGLKVTKILVVVTGMLFLSWLPFWVLKIGAIVNPVAFQAKNDSMRVLFHMLNHFIYINNGINPLLYALTSASFRHDCRSAWRKIKMCLINQA